VDQKAHARLVVGDEHRTRDLHVWLSAISHLATGLSASASAFQDTARPAAQRPLSAEGQSRRPTPAAREFENVK